MSENWSHANCSFRFDVLVREPLNSFISEGDVERSSVCLKAWLKKLFLLAPQFIASKLQGFTASLCHCAWLGTDISKMYGANRPGLPGNS